TADPRDAEDHQEDRRDVADDRGRDRHRDGDSGRDPDGRRAVGLDERDGADGDDAEELDGVGQAEDEVLDGGEEVLHGAFRSVLSRRAVSRRLRIRVLARALRGQDRTVMTSTYSRQARSMTTVTALPWAHVRVRHRGRAGRPGARAAAFGDRWRACDVVERGGLAGRGHRRRARAGRRVRGGGAADRGDARRADRATPGGDGSARGGLGVGAAVACPLAVLVVWRWRVLYS